MSATEELEVSHKLLPEEFRDLQRFAGEWALATEPERIRKRYASTLKEMKEFYDVMRTRAEAALEHLNRFPLDRLPEPERQLLCMIFSFVEISLSVEVFGAPGVPYGYDPMRYACAADGNPSLPYGWRALRLQT